MAGQNAPMHQNELLTKEFRSAGILEALEEYFLRVWYKNKYGIAMNKIVISLH